MFNDASSRQAEIARLSGRSSQSKLAARLFWFQPRSANEQAQTYFSTRTNTPVEAFTATVSLAVSREAP
jgi:hypothetical protein